jgi:hypothetical protein
MREAVRTLLVVVLFSPAVLGQKSAKTRTHVIWSSEAECSKLNTPDVRSAQPRCTNAAVERTTYYIIIYKGISYAMTFRPSQRFIVASVQVSNYSGSPISVIPSKSRMSRFLSEAEFADGGAAADHFSALSRDKLREVKYVSDPVAEPEGAIRPGLQTSEVYEQRINRTGQIVTERTRVGPKPGPDETQSSHTRTSLLVTRSIFDNLLASKDLADKEKIAGHLVFKTSEEKGFYVLFLSVGDLDFVFPIGDASIQ